MKTLSIRSIKDKMNQLRGLRGTWETHWQEIADYMLPRKNTITAQRHPGEKRNIQIFDSTGMNSLELLAGALHGMLTNPDAFWFELTSGDSSIDKQDDVRMFFQNTVRTMHNVLNNSNFQTEVHEFYLDLCGFGTSSMFIEEDDDYEVRFSTKYIKDYLIDENHLGNVDQIYLEFNRTAAQIVNEYGKEKVPEKIMRCFEKNQNDKFKVAVALYPQSMVEAGSSQKTYVSHHFLVDDEIELRVSKFNEFPAVVARWSKGTGEMYGTSPAMIALPEVKVINKMEEVVLNGAQKVIDPPIQLPDDGYVLPIITRPGGINYKRSGSDPITPIFNDTRIDFGFEVTNRKRMRIRESFYVDQLQLQQGPAMTATEVLQRTEEKMRLLGPLLGRQQSEFLRPLIDRVFAILIRRGVIDIRTIPQVLMGRKIDVRYSSLVAKSQRLAEGQAILRTFQAAAPFIQLDPSAADLMNAERAVRVLAEIYGFPQEVIRTQREITDIREQRAQALAAEQAAAQENQEMDNMMKMAQAGAMTEQ